MNHPAIPSRRPSLASRLRDAWNTLTGRHVLLLGCRNAPGKTAFLWPCPEGIPTEPPIYLCAALHLHREGGRSTLSLGTLQTNAPAHHIEAAFLGHLVNHSPELRAQQLIHVCTVPASQVIPYPTQP